MLESKSKFDNSHFKKFLSKEIYSTNIYGGYIEGPTKSWEVYVSYDSSGTPEAKDAKKVDSDFKFF